MRYAFCLAVFLGMSPESFGASYLEKSDRVEINWTKHRIQFYGYAQPSVLGGGKDDFKAIEKKAWKEGIAYIAKKSRDIYMANFEELDFTPKQLTDQAQKVAQSVAQSTMSTNTVYYPNGGVQVILESNLTNIMASADLKFSQKESGMTGTTHFSGIFIKLDRATKPRVFYKIIAEDGKLLFDYRSIAEDSFSKNLSGRWVVRPSEAEIEDLSGLQPLVVEAQVISDGLFQIRRQDWENATLGHRGLLSSGAILIGMP